MLLAAASGAFAPAFGRVIEAHAALCPRCRATMANVESIGGHALERETDADLMPGALDHALTAIESAPRESALPAELNDLPREVHELIAPIIGTSRWRFGGCGVKLRTLQLPRIADEKLRLLWIQPDGYLPRHTHDGHEFVLVLTGAYKDETGIYSAGDVAFGDASLEHLPKAMPGEVCFALAATTSPLRFTGVLGLMQRHFNFPNG